MNKNLLLLITLIAICSCNESKVIDNNSQFSNNANSTTNESNSTVLNFNYNYPKNIIPSRDEENSIEFYPIGFSPEGNFAYINRPCNGGCGCCTHDLIIQDLLTDKIETNLTIRSTDGTESKNHLPDWNYNFSNIERSLKLKGISQSQLRIESGLIFNDKYNQHTYEVKINKRVKENTYSPEEGDELTYSVYVTIDNSKSKRITYGKIENSYDLEYIGFIRSPFSDIVSILLNKKTRGFEAEIDNEIVAIGCHLDPSFY
jgi:hypothetical protein